MNETLMRWTGGISLLAALWLVFSPLWTNYTSNGNLWAQVIVGIVVGIVAIAKLAAPTVTWPSGINFAAGLWFIIAPWILPSTTAVKWNQVVLGIIVTLLATIELSTTERAAEIATDADGLSTREAAMGFGERIPGRRSDEDNQDNL